jgi:hypothetical protein
MSLGVRRPALAGHGGEPDEQVGRLADLGKDLGIGKVGDVVRRSERT